tara:strand:+ start:6298 stop:6642 length:345 start_codon:yes stop_codon:yes gene_type:complete
MPQYTRNYDANRVKKIYPLIRLKPVTTTLSGSADHACIDAETAIIAFGDISTNTYDFTKTYTFVKNYNVLPVIALSVEDENVNVFVTSLTTTSITIESSAPFIGKVHLQVFKGE